MIGELAALVLEGRAARAADAEQLLTGYVGAPRGRWVEGNCALAYAGAAELAISADLAVLVEGRLDNRADLIRRTRAPARLSTAELLAAGWRLAGSDLVDWLVGDLAGIVVDRRTGQVHAFRDLCAGRPLHVTRHRAGWACASEWQPLASIRGTRNKPNEAWFAAAFVGYSFDASATPCNGVDMVLPGHVARPSSAGWMQLRSAEWHVPTLTDRRTGAYTDEFRALLDEAVRCRLVGQNEVGISLSGGLDSTSVMASATAVRPDASRSALCLPMREPPGDERELQALVAHHCGSQLQWVDPEYEGPFGFNGPADLFDRFGAPPLVINWFLGDAVAEASSQLGLKLVLDGEDGDGSLGGSLSFLSDLLARGRMLRWYREADTLRRNRVRRRKDLLKESLYSAAPPMLRRAYRRRIGFSLAPEVLAEPLCRRLDLEGRVEDTTIHGAWRAGQSWRLAQAEVGKPEQVGPVFTAISEPWRRRGICLTHPWADRRLMSFCMGLPYEHVVRSDGLTKVVLREAIKDRLPSEIVNRRGKANISEVARRAAFGRDIAHVEQGLKLARRQTDWFDPSVVKSAEDTFNQGLGEARALRIAMFAWWLNWCETSPSRGTTAATNMAAAA